MQNKYKTELTPSHTNNLQESVHAMNTDFRSLERRYGGPMALKIQEEILRAEARSFSFYRMPKSSLQDH